METRKADDRPSGGLRINHDKGPAASPGSEKTLDRLQRVIDGLNGLEARPPDVIKLNIEIPVENARKLLVNIRDFVESIIPKGPDDGPR